MSLLGWGCKGWDCKGWDCKGWDCKGWDCKGRRCKGRGCKGWAARLGAADGARRRWRPLVGPAGTSEKGGLSDPPRSL